MRMSSGLFRQRVGAADDLRWSRRAVREPELRACKILFHDDDPTSTIAVTESSSRALITNGKSDGNLRFDYTTMALSGWFRLSSADDPSRVFVIGWGLGVTSGVLGSLDDVKEVVAAEISPARPRRRRRSSTRATRTRRRTRRSTGSAATPTAPFCAARASSA